MIHIKQDNHSNAYVYDDELLLASFSNLNAAIEYARITDQFVPAKDRRPSQLLNKQTDRT